MNIDFSVILTSAITSIAAIACLRYQNILEIKKDKRTLIEKQECEYFLKFKWISDEFERRIAYLLAKMDNEKINRDSLLKSFRRNLDNPCTKDLNWYFDSNYKDGSGCVLATTMYLNCILFYWLKECQWSHPFMCIKIDKKSLAKDPYYKDIKNVLEELDNKLSINLDKKCDFRQFTKAIKITLAERKGIHYAMQESIGDYIYNYTKNKIMNYEEFIKQLIDDNTRIKFAQLINFWTNIYDKDDKLDTEIINKLINLRYILLTIKYCKLK